MTGAAVWRIASPSREALSREPDWIRSASAPAGWETQLERTAIGQSWVVLPLFDVIEEIA